MLTLGQNKKRSTPKFLKNRQGLWGGSKKRLTPPCVKGLFFVPVTVNKEMGTTALHQETNRGKKKTSPAKRGSRDKIQFSGSHKRAA